MKPTANGGLLPSGRVTAQLSLGTIGCQTPHRSTDARPYIAAAAYG